ncbi:MAG TPA: multicopper oxidase domain-containing protein [Gemmatimonadales bacterium]|nr:multicopper oxidase domain-containing protein [Gemmatimonadales bacterium]
MPTSPPSISDLDFIVAGATPTSRRLFLSRASALGIALPSMGAALAACTRTEPRGGAGGAGTQRPERHEGEHGEEPEHAAHNPDSRLDTALHHPRHPTSAVPGATAGAASVEYHRRDAELPPAAPGKVKRIHMTVRETPVRIRPDLVVAAWTFDGDVPGPVVHVRQGDTVEFTLTNEGVIPHSMDFHAAQIDPKIAFRSVPHGQSVSYTFRPKYAGAFLYHCGTSPVLMHLGSGMFGAIIVDPPKPLPPAKEFVLVQNEYYLTEPHDGVAAFSYAKALSLLPDVVCFNGRPTQYQDAPFVVKRGDRVRFYVVDAGPTHPCAFHVVGEQFDTVYLGAPPGNAFRGVQTFNVAAGGGMIFELVADVAGDFPFVNHAFGHGQKGAIGVLRVE